MKIPPIEYYSVKRFTFLHTSQHSSTTWKTSSITVSFVVWTFQFLSNKLTVKSWACPISLNSHARILSLASSHANSFWSSFNKLGISHTDTQSEQITSSLAISQVWFSISGAWTICLLIQKANTHQTKRINNQHKQYFAVLFIFQEKNKAISLYGFPLVFQTIFQKQQASSLENSRNLIIYLTQFIIIDFMENISRALIFDSVFDPYKGVLAYVKVVDWSFSANEDVYLVHSEKSFQPTEVGHFTPEYQADKALTEWQIGYIVTWQKSVRDVQIWDTIIKIKTNKSEETEKYNQYLIPWFKKVTPFVYAGVYPIDSTEYDKLKDSLEKLSLNDSAVTYEMEDSKALGLWFRCWFLGMLHMDIIKERLFREYNLDTIFTIPTVMYLVKSKNLSIHLIKSWMNYKDLIQTGLYQEILKRNDIKLLNHDKEILEHSEWITAVMIENPIFKKVAEILKPRIVVKSWSDMIDQGMIDEILEPIASVEIVGPEEYAWNIMSLCQEYRGKLTHMEYLDATRVVRHYELPMWEIIVDFYDRLKSSTKGYATMNYEFKWYNKDDLVKLDIFINNEKVEALTWVVHNDKAYYLGREVVEKLKTLIPKHLFAIPIQAWLGNKIIARENISAIKKDVLAKCYWWDVSRKRKLLQKQKEGKKRMKAIGNVEIPTDTFIKMVTRE